MGYLKIFIFATILLQWQVLFCSLAVADDKLEASKHFEAGNSLLSVRNYVEAAKQFEASVNLYPTQSALFNLANCFQALGKYAEALEIIERLKREFGNELNPDIRAAVPRHEHDLREIVAKLTIKVNRDGADVILDGKRIGQSPINGSIIVGPGNHTIEIDLSGFKKAQRTVNLTSGADTTETFELLAVSPVEIKPSERAPATEPEEAQAAPKEHTEQKTEHSTGAETGLADVSGEKKSPVFFWVGLGTTLALGATTVALNFVVQDRLDQLEKDRTNKDLRDESKTLQLTGRIFLGLTGAALVTTAVLAIFTDFSRKGAKEKSVAAVPILGADGVGLGLQGSF